jgi:hypothetical protein
LNPPTPKAICNSVLAGALRAELERRERAPRRARAGSRVTYHRA